MNKVLLLCLITTLKAVTINLETERQEMLTQHNYYRALHQVDDLVRLSGIENIAQNYSQYLVSIGTMVHSSNYYQGSKLGENLYWGPKKNGIGKSAVDLWYNEVSEYDFNNPGYKSGIGHFTQVVWKNSKKLGCGIGCGSNNYCYVVCNYNPAGNYLNSFGSNVFPKIEEESDTTTTEPETQVPESDTTATEPENASTSPELENFRNAITNRHNYYRNQHQAGNLERDSELERIAQEAAEHMVEIDNFYFTTATYNGNYIGKNLFWRFRTVDGSEVTDSLYDGAEKYDYNNPGYSSETGSFTQLVWKNTKKIGCGYACNSKGGCYGNCVYYPGGNFSNSFSKNVFPKVS